MKFNLQKFPALLFVQKLQHSLNQFMPLSTTDRPKEVFGIHLMGNIEFIRSDIYNISLSKYSYINQKYR